MTIPAQPLPVVISIEAAKVQGDDVVELEPRHQPAIAPALGTPGVLFSEACAYGLQPAPAYAVHQAGSE